MKKEVSVASRYYRSFRTGREYRVPFIRLSGRWLDAIGFNEGARIRVSGGRRPTHAHNFVPETREAAGGLMFKLKVVRPGSGHRRSRLLQRQRHITP